MTTSDYLQLATMAVTCLVVAIPFLNRWVFARHFPSKRLSYTVEGETVAVIPIDEKLATQFSLTYKSLDEQVFHVQQAALATVRIWNSGVDVVRFVSQTTGKGPSLRLSFRDGDNVFLDVVRLTTPKGIEVQFERGEGSVNVYADFLNPSESIVLEVLHSGSAGASPVVEGRVEGGRIIEDITPRARYTVRVYGLILLAGSTVFLVHSIRTISAGLLVFGAFVIAMGSFGFFAPRSFSRFFRFP